MPALAIAYDLNTPGKDYGRLIARIKQLSTNDHWWHHLDSLWVIRTSVTAAQARDDLNGYIDGNDELLVIDVTHDGWAGVGFTNDAYDYLRSVINR